MNNNYEKLANIVTYTVLVCVLIVTIRGCFV